MRRYGKNDLHSFGGRILFRLVHSAAGSTPGAKGDHYDQWADSPDGHIGISLEREPFRRGGEHLHTVESLVESQDGQEDGAPVGPLSDAVIANKSQNNFPHGRCMGP